MKIRGVSPFDGDEMNIHVQQTLSSMAEEDEILSCRENITTPQSCAPIFKIGLDALTAAHILTDKHVKINKGLFNDITLTYTDIYSDMKGYFKDPEDKKKHICSIFKKFQVYKNKALNIIPFVLKYLSNKDIIKFKILCKGKFMCKHENDQYENGYQVCVKCGMKLYSCYNGYGLLSMILPNNFDYFGGKLKLKIVRGVIISGTIQSGSIGNKQGSIIHVLNKYYSNETVSTFISQCQIFCNAWLLHNGFSVGISDCVPTEKVKTDITNNIIKTYVEAYNILQVEKDPKLREMKLNFVLNNAQNIGDKIMAKSVNETNNRLLTMIKAESKGNNVNVSQIHGCVGQQLISGSRIPKSYGLRSFPHFVKSDLIYPGLSGVRDFKETKSIDNFTNIFRNPDKMKSVLQLKINENCKLNKLNPTTEFKRIECLKPKHEFDDYKLNHQDKLFQSRGYVRSSYNVGLNPIEFFCHAAGGREGVISTANGTGEAGYLSRKMVKLNENIKYDYNGTINNNKGSVIAFHLAESNMDPRHLVKVGQTMQFCNIETIANQLNNDEEYGEML